MRHSTLKINHYEYGGMTSFVSGKCVIKSIERLPIACLEFAGVALCLPIAAILKRISTLNGFWTESYEPFHETSMTF